MRRRIYWLLPDLASATNTLDRLLLARIGERNVRFVGHAGVDLADLPAAGVLRTSDVVRSAQAGTTLGAVTAAGAGLVAAGHGLVDGSSPPWAVVGLLATAGALFGAWIAAVVGLGAPSRGLKCFQPALADGQILMMVDVPRSRVEAVTRCLLSAPGWVAESLAGHAQCARTGDVDRTRAEADPGGDPTGTSCGVQSRPRRVDAPVSASATLRRLRHGLPS